MTPARPSFDPGLTTKYTGPLQRSINKDGSFNVRRSGVHNLAGSIYLHLVTMSWPRFLSLVALAYLIANLMFACIYLGLGPGTLGGNTHDDELGRFGTGFFFSVHTLTTVGYGALYPVGIAANVVAALEAALGLMGFALATSLLYARFSRPTARLVFSRQMVMAPYRGITSFQFRVANQRSNVLMEVHADLMLSTVERGADGELKRNFAELSLERRSVYFLALTWTVVHPVDQSSPLWGKTPADLEAMQAEFMILIKGFDDSFSQVVHSRYSYRWDEIAWSSRFTPAFQASSSGEMLLDLSKISDTSAAGSQ